MGIRGKLIAFVGILSLVAVAVIGAASYKFSTASAISEAKTKGEIIFNYIKSQRAFFKDEQRSIVLEIVEQDRFYPELMSGFVVTRGTWAKFKENMPGYLFKQATIDPLHKDNKADADELKIISKFQSDDKLKKQEGLISKDGGDYFYLATPIKVNAKGCLRCHGDPMDAPKDQIEIYGDTNGYNWKMDDTVAAFVVYIPISQAMAAARKSAASLLAIGAGTILIMLICIALFLNGAVVKPIMVLSSRTEEISLGKNLTEPIEHKSKDEIGMLAQAINRLRISMVKILSMTGKK
ncbi:MAG: hypothetical protein C0608_00670 [Deltaproteobacteria bacterium]|nr:MAG: hypothetical protein C0608_00670 [Deltaproteobacteria bacterium]